MQGKNIRAVLFDLDGTLVDTIEDIIAALNAALGDEGLEPLTVKQGKSVVGRGLRNAISKALQLRSVSVSAQRLDALFAVLTEYYRSHATDFCKPYEHIAPLLQSLNEKNIPIGVFSNKDDVLTKEIIAKVFPSVRFEWVRGMRDDFPSKPDKAGLLKFCGKIGISIESLLYVGDSEVDYQAAENAGCPHVLVTWGFRERSELMHIEGVHLVDSVKELEEACNGLH
jgi:phosphoglycolate phosphatase